MSGPRASRGPDEERENIAPADVAEVRKLGPGWHCDGGGLYALVAAPDRGSWVYRYQTRNMGLGSLAVVSLAEARASAASCEPPAVRG